MPLFDLSFLDKNEPLQLYREIAQTIIDKNYTYRNNPVFAQFADNHFPGESILVTRMMYEIIKRLHLAQNVPAERLAYFKTERTDGMGVQFIDQTLSQAIGNPDPNTFFSEGQQKALAITFEEGPPP